MTTTPEKKKAWVQANPEKMAASRARWRENNLEKARRQNRESAARRRAALKLEMIAAYGGRCSCCSETHPAFLAMDHVNGRDAEDTRLGDASWAHAKKLGWPDTFTCLCHNCNQGRQINGGVCPHKVDDDGRTE